MSPLFKQLADKFSKDAVLFCKIDVDLLPVSVDDIS